MTNETDVVQSCLKSKLALAALKCLFFVLQQYVHFTLNFTNYWPCVLR